MLRRIDPHQHPGLRIVIKESIQTGAGLGLEVLGHSVFQIDDHLIGAALQRLGYPLGASSRDEQR